jgi:transposase
MSSQYEPLTDSQWQLLEPLFPKPLKRGRGKPHTPWRFVVNSILMVLVSQVKWSSIPKSPEFATKSASHRWFVLWDKSGFLKELVEAYKAAIRQEAEVVHPPRRQRLSKSAYQQLALQVSEEPSYTMSARGI